MADVDLTTPPRPRVTRVNRVAIGLVALLAVSAVWLVAYFVAEKPAVRGEASATRPTATDAALLRQFEEEARRVPPRPVAESAPPAREEGGSLGAGRGDEEGVVRGEVDSEARELVRARHAGLVPAMFRAAGAERGVAAGAGGPAGAAGALPPPPDFGALARSLAASRDGGGGEGPGRGEEGEGGFLAAARRAEAPSPVGPPRAPAGRFMVRAGTLLPAILESGVHSELPGLARAVLARPVYDSRTGRYLLLPRGSALLGEYDHQVVWGQDRVLIAWQELTLPDGRVLDLKGFAGADLLARAGLHDRVDNHFARTFGTAILLSAVSAGAQLSQPREATASSLLTPSQIATAALGQELSQVTGEVLRRQLDVAPTLEIRPGTLFNVEATADIVFEAPYR